jgi:hypothetical protein
MPTAWLQRSAFPPIGRLELNQTVSNALEMNWLVGHAGMSRTCAPSTARRPPRHIGWTLGAISITLPSIPLPMNLLAAFETRSVHLALLGPDEAGRKLLRRDYFNMGASTMVSHRCRAPAPRRPEGR